MFVKYYRQVALYSSSLPLGEEPLLKESLRRFVLFPIQYEEVSSPILIQAIHFG